MARWWMALAGLFLSVFAVVASSGPGRIDIIDGRVRYEVARSLVEHGDVDIQDPKINFTILPGRGGRRYSQYRFPQSAAGVAAILASDAIGAGERAPPAFLLLAHERVASAVLAATYAVLFRRLGIGPKASLLWAAAGIFCTPNWYYGTSTFDDILGTAAVVLAVAFALGCRQCHPRAGAVAAGLALGLAFNCKQPLGIFVLPVMGRLRSRNRLAVAMGAAGDRRRPAGRRGCRMRELRMVQVPSGSTAGHAELLKHGIRPGRAIRSSPWWPS